MPTQENVTIENVLFKKLLQEELLPEEHTALEQWLSVDSNRSLYTELSHSDSLQQQLILLNSFEKKRQSAKDKLIEEFIAAGTPVVSITKKKVWPKYLAAAIVVPGLALGAYYFIIGSLKKETTVVKSTIQPVDVMPATTDMATLTLADGSKIVLDNAKGLVSEQGNTKVVKLASGELVYQVEESKIQENTVAYNTLSTPRKGKQHIKLSDGTEVWLNAATDLTYPLSFRGSKERIVSVSGEAYFQVAKDAQKPFKVKLLTPNGEKGIIEVLGTHFNVNVYGDEPSIKTTLLEGKVKITAALQSSQILSSGQQAVLNNNTINIDRNADVESTMAWRNEMIWLEKTDLPAIFREISRAYDVDVEYTTKITPTADIRFRTFKNTPLSQVLKALKEALGKNVSLQFNIVAGDAGNKIVVSDH